MVKKLCIPSSALATMRLRELARVAGVMRDHGELLDHLAWLKVLANVLSAAEPKKTKTAAPFRGLSYLSLTYHAEKCGLGASDAQIRAQIAETNAWRDGLAADGRPFRPTMSADTIGKVLGITDDIREEAKAWNLGTYGGSRAGRAKAKRERDIQRKQAKRRLEGCMSRKDYEGTSLSRTKPWEVEGLSRAAWYRRRDANGKAQVRQVRRETSPAHQYRSGETSPARHYLNNSKNAFSPSGLKAIVQSEAPWAVSACLTLHSMMAFSHHRLLVIGDAPEGVIDFPWIEDAFVVGRPN